MKIQILVDNRNSWIIPYAKQLVSIVASRGHDVILTHNPEEVQEGDILCLLSCERIFRNLHLNKHNLVVHESDLPQGKGWSPMTWQVLEGRNQITVTLFEAVESVDAGPIYLQEAINLTGYELIDEIRELEGKMTIKLITDYVSMYPAIKGKEQMGGSSFYRRRSAEDSRLDIDKTVRQQFNLLRTVDNERYPAYFEIDGRKYVITIKRYR